MPDHLRVLVVEDDPGDADLVREILPATGAMPFQVEVVSRLATALSRLERGGIDLVLLDLGLPDSQGLPTLRTLIQKAPELPVVVFTGRDDPDLAVAAVHDGAQDFLVKGQFSTDLLTRSIRYAVERKRVEVQARERETLLATTLASTVDGILVVDDNGKTILTNRRFAELWEIPPALLESANDPAMLEYVLGELVDPDAFLRKVKLLYGSDDVAMDTLQFKNGQVLERYSLPLRSGGRHLGRVWSFHDITERQKADTALLESRALLKAIVDGTTDAVYVKDLDGRYKLFNHAAVRFTGKTEAEVLGKDDFAIFPSDEAKTVMAREQEPFLEVAPRSYEETVTFANGQPMTFWTTSGPIVGPDGKPVAIFGVSRDITARKAAEARLQEMVQEKEALLKEVHHRVKNNLQVIASLLRLESARSEHPDTRSVLGEMQGRVRSMALLHEALNRSGTFAAVDLGGYLQRLATESFRALVAAPGAVQLRLNLASVSVEMDQAMPCGLLVNELIANTLEHGFPDGCTGEVLIELQPMAENSNWQLRVSDTGVGLPTDFEARRSRSLGLQLVGDLAGQLGGTLRVGPGPDAVFTVTFPVHYKPLSPNAV